MAIIFLNFLFSFSKFNPIHILLVVFVHLIFYFIVIIILNCNNTIRYFKIWYCKALFFLQGSFFAFSNLYLQGSNIHTIFIFLEINSKLRPPKKGLTGFKFLCFFLLSSSGHRISRSCCQTYWRVQIYTRIHIPSDEMQCQSFKNHPDWVYIL